MIFSRFTLLVVSAALSITNAHYHDWGAEGEGWEGYHHHHGDWSGGLRGDKRGDGGRGGGGGKHGGGGRGGGGGHHGGGGRGGGGRGGGGRGGRGRGGRGSSAITVEKGFKCAAGGFGGDGVNEEENNGALKSFQGCEGGVKKTFPEQSHPHGIAADMAQSLQDHMQENLIPDVSDLMPASDTMMELLELAPENLLEELQEGESRSVKFGGKSTMTFECSISVTMKEGKPTKTSECGFKSSGHMGKGGGGKPEDNSDEPKVAELVVTEEVKEVMREMENEEEVEGESQD